MVSAAGHSGVRQAQERARREHGLAFAETIWPEGDIVLTMSDGVTDNLWEYEIADKVVDSFEKWKDDIPRSCLTKSALLQLFNAESTQAEQELHVKVPGLR